MTYPDQWHHIQTDNFHLLNFPSYHPNRNILILRRVLKRRDMSTKRCFETNPPSRRTTRTAKPTPGEEIWAARRPPGLPKAQGHGRGQAGVEKAWRILAEREESHFVHISNYGGLPDCASARFMRWFCDLFMPVAYAHQSTGCFVTGCSLSFTGGWAKGM